MHAYRGEVEQPPQPVVPLCEQRPAQLRLKLVCSTLLQQLQHDGTSMVYYSVCWTRPSLVGHDAC
jgi:hypothetical protein